MPKKQGKKAKTEGPLALSMLEERGFLEGFSPPTEAFAPAGAWKHSYDICLTDGKPPGKTGILAIERALGATPKSATLTVEMQVLQTYSAVQRTKATIQCANDALSTPQSWQMESVLLNPDGQPIAETKVEEKATVKEGMIEVEPLNAPKEVRRSRTMKVPAPFTANWCLLDAVQRLSLKDMPPLPFALLEELDLLKEGQSLYLHGPTSLTVNGKALPLTEYVQIGEGILPYHYGLDAQRRLLFVASARRAYIWNPSAAQGFEETRQRASRRKGR